MGEPVSDNGGGKRQARWGSRLALAVIGLLGLAALAIAVYLATPFPARQLSSYLSSYLHQGVGIDRLQISGATIYLKGVRLANPSGFPKENLASADLVAIAPVWSDLLSGRQNYRMIALEGIRVSLRKNDQGAWNFAGIRQFFAKRKPSREETRIGEFSIKGGSLGVNGQEVHGIALHLFNLATKGSRASTVDVSFEDAARNPFSLKGEARPGPAPALDLTLTAPSISLAGVARELKLKQPEILQGGTGSLEVHAGLNRGELRATGTFRFDHLRYHAAGKTFPVAGSLDFTADYSPRADAAHLKTLQLSINDLVHLHAEGAVQELRRNRRFNLDAGFNAVDLATVSALVPEPALKGYTFGGRLEGRTLHFAGNAGAITDASGSLHLRQGWVSKGKTLYLSGLAGDIGVARGGEGITAKGMLTVSRPAERALLTSLDLPFELALSRRMKPLRARFPALSAQLLGVAFTGRAAFDAGNPNPWTASLTVPETRLTAIRPLLERYDVGVSAGTAAVALDFSGKSVQQFGADLSLDLANLEATRGKERLAAKRGRIGARLSRGGGHFSAQGNADLKGATVDGKGGDARFGYRLSGDTMYLDQVEASLAGTQLAVSRLTAKLPSRAGKPQAVPPAAASYPVSFDFDGGSFKRGDLAIASVSGRARGNLASGPAGKWLEGTAELSAGSLAWHGKPVAAPTLRAVFSRSGGKGELGGSLLGGRLSGTVSGDPFAPRKSAGFDLDLKHADVAAALPFLPKGAQLKPTGGSLDLDLKGTYALEGLSCRFSSKGKSLAFAGAGGKTLMPGSSLTLSGDLANDLLTVSQARFSPGPDVVLSAEGKILHPLAKEPSGTLNFSLGETTANSIIDPLVNVLPRAVQEATIDGRLAARGEVELRGGSKLLEGTLTVTGGRYEVTQQKLAVSGINGRFPISLDLSGKTGGKPPAALAFSRDNYGKLLAQLQRTTGIGESFSIDRVAFGPLELENLSLHLKATNGITEITSLRSSLYDGVLLGKGYLTMRRELGYRGDLLVDGLSLKLLCSKFPGIKGYISGRVDGVLSISGGPKGVAGLTGFTELWAREGRGEKMLVSKEFLQRLAKQKLGGFFFRSDRSYDDAEIKVLMQGGYLTFETLKIVHTNFFGVRDLNVNISPTQNRIELGHLFDSIKEAASRGKVSAGAPPAQAPAQAPASQEFKWGE